MKKIKRFVHTIDDEIESAEHYAEKYIEHKAEGDTSTAEKYKLYAQQELTHAEFIHELASNYIAKVSKIITPPADMKAKWEESHECYIDKVKEIKSILSL